MTEQRRNLMLDAMDGHSELAPLMWHLDRLTRCDQVLMWLIKNKITGQKLNEYWLKEHRGSILGMCKEIIRRICKDNELRPILVGRDYKVGR